MTQAGQWPTAACKEDHVEVDGFRIRYWEAGPPRPVGAVVMLEAMTWGLDKLRDALLKQQDSKGHWPGGGGQEAEAGDAYRTSMAVLALCVPYRYLPLYQK